MFDATSKQCMHVCRAAARLDAVVTRLQAIRRGACQRRAYLQTQQRIVLLQAAFRAFPARMQFLQAKGAAIWIQSCWRRHQAQQLILNIKVCTCALPGMLACMPDCCGHRTMLPALCWHLLDHRLPFSQRRSLLHPVIVSRHTLMEHIWMFAAICFIT